MSFNTRDELDKEFTNMADELNELDARLFRIGEDLLPMFLCANGQNTLGEMDAWEDMEGIDLLGHKTSLDLISQMREDVEIAQKKIEIMKKKIEDAEIMAMMDDEIMAMTNTVVDEINDEIESMESQFRGMRDKMTEMSDKADENYDS